MTKDSADKNTFELMLECERNGHDYGTTNYYVSHECFDHVEYDYFRVCGKCGKSRAISEEEMASRKDYDNRVHPYKGECMWNKIVCEVKSKGDFMCEHIPYFAAAPMAFCDKCGEPLSWEDGKWVVNRPVLLRKSLEILVRDRIGMVIGANPNDQDLGAVIRRLYG